MLGLMQTQPLLISGIISHAALQHGKAEVVSRLMDGRVHRSNYAETERRAKRLARALLALGVEPGDRVATLAWNTHRHLEAYYGISGMGAVCHTVNPRLPEDDVAYILAHAEDRVILADTTFAALLSSVLPRAGASIKAVVMLCGADEMPEVTVPAGVKLLSYEALLADSPDDYEWPLFDENTACALCYTSGTTGRPKGVLYSHRATLLHAYASNGADVFGFRAVDRALPIVSMYHVNAWGMPYSVPMTGAAMILPGRHLDPASLLQLIEQERVTISAGVPTVWLALLQHLRDTGARVDSLERIVIGGSSCPPLLIEAFGRNYDVRVQHAWGMTEMSPLGTFNQPTPYTAALTGDDAMKMALKQGRPICGVEMKIVGAAGETLPRDGESFGDLMVRGPWVCSAYYKPEDGEPRHDEAGWFQTGDVGTLDEHGYLDVTDRSKDIIKSGGEWIGSTVLENLAVGHPEVAEAAAVAMPDEKWGERPMLLLVPKVKGAIVESASVLRLYDGKVPKWWVPDRVEMIAELPHTATGKINKRVLRERYWAKG